ncbi:MAG: DUF3459 domain-containing protein [Arthrobacter sp.]
MEPDGSYGFSPDSATDPWLPTPPSWGTLSVEARRNDPQSTLHFVRDALRLRGQLIDKEIFTRGDACDWRVEDNGLLICARGEQVLLAVAMGDEPCRLPEGNVLLASEPLTPDGMLPPDSAAWILQS